MSERDHYYSDNLLLVKCRPYSFSPASKPVVHKLIKRFATNKLIEIPGCRAPLSNVFLRKWQLNNNRGARIYLRRNLDGAMMQFDNALHHGKADAVSFDSGRI